MPAGGHLQPVDVTVLVTKDTKLTDEKYKDQGRRLSQRFEGSTEKADGCHTGLQIAEYLAMNSRGARLREIAAAVQMDPGQTHRMISAMVEDGWLMPVGDDGSYSLWARVIRLGAIYIQKLDLAEHAQPFLNELAKETGEFVFLGEVAQRRGGLRGPTGGGPDVESLDRNGRFLAFGRECRGNSYPSS